MHQNREQETERKIKKYLRLIWHKPIATSQWLIRTFV